MDRPFELEELLTHSGWLRALAARLVADPAAADDLVQETWIAALRRPPKADDSPRPWLARVARNLARNARREGRTRGEHELRSHEERRPPTPEGIALEVETQRLLAEAVGALAEPGRTVVVLRYFRGLDSAQIARELAMPAGTVRWRLKQALEELRAELDRRRGGREAWAGLLLRLLRDGAPPPALVAGASTAWLVPGAAALLLLGGVAAWRATRQETASAATTELARLAPSAVAEPEAPVALAPAGESERVERGVAAPPPEVADATISGRVWLGGRIPPPLRLEFVMLRDDPPSRFVTSATDGTFSLGGFPDGWDGMLRVSGYDVEDGMKGALLSAPASSVELRLRDGPTLTGRFLEPSTRRPILVPPGRIAHNGEFELQFGRNRSGVSAMSGLFRTDDEGRFRVALTQEEGELDTELERTTPERMTARLLAEVPGFARTVVEVPEFVRAEGYDVGDVVLLPAASVRFRVLDASGAPIAGAAAKHEDWPSTVTTDRQGRGKLKCVALAGESIRFGAPKFADRVIHVFPGEAPDVFLEPTNALQIRVVGADGGPLPAFRLYVSNHDTLFIKDDHMLPSFVGGRGHSTVSFMERERTAYFVMRFDEDSSGELLLRSLEPDVPFTVEVRALDGRVLAVRECLLGDREWQELVIPISN